MIDTNHMTKKQALRMDSKQCGSGNTDADYEELSYDNLVQAAHEEHADPSNNDIEIDLNPLTSRGDVGAWVQAWVWVRYPEKDED